MMTLPPWKPWIWVGSKARAPSARPAQAIEPEMDDTVAPATEI